VKNRDGVPIFRKSILLSLLGPELEEVAHVKSGVDLVLFDQRRQIDQLIVERKLWVPSQMIRKNIGRGPGNESGADSGPIVTPGRLGDFDGDVRIFLLKFGRAGLVGWELVSVP